MSKINNLQKAENDVEIYNHGLKYMNNGQFSKAKQLFESKIHTYQDSAIINLGLGTALRKLKEYEEAKTYLLKSISINPKLFDGNYGMAVILDEQKNFLDSIEYYKKAIQLNPTQGKKT